MQAAPFGHRLRQGGFMRIGRRWLPKRRSAVARPKISMDFEGADGGDVFTDDGTLGLTWTRSGANVTTSIAQILAGSTSLRVNGATDYLETSGFLLPATGDWELSFKLYLTSAAGKTIISICDATASAAGSQIRLYMSTANGTGNAANYVYLYVSNGTTFNAIAQTNVWVGQNASQDWKIKRVGSTISIDVNNGAITGSGTFSGSINQPAGRKFRIGKPEITGENGPNVVHMDTLRFN